MGAMLPKPVLSCVVELRRSGKFNVGTAELNGWRNNMEDAHLALVFDDWAVFGVFDGHGGDQCSAWIAERLTKEFKNTGRPKDDEAVKELFLRVDREFLDTGLPSGTTATMCIVEKLGNGKNRLRVINSGDSRVVLGHRDGKIFADGKGTDQGLTTDHKPDHPSERERIEANGGTVELAMGGVARLNGDLAVSRGFGDAEYKKQGKDPKNLENQPATANPEMETYECDDNDFLLLVCDGVSEGDFSNSEVVQFVADALKKKEDPGVASAGVCRKAVKQNSKDNVTCMCVLFNNLDGESERKEYFAGPMSCPTDSGFMKAYNAMVARAGLTLAQALQKRYEQVQSSEKWYDGVLDLDEDKEDAEFFADAPGDGNFQEFAARKFPGEGV